MKCSEKEIAEDNELLIKGPWMGPAWTTLFSVALILFQRDRFWWLVCGVMLGISWSVVMRYSLRCHNPWRGIYEYIKAIGALAVVYLLYFLIAWR